MGELISKAGAATELGLALGKSIQMLAKFVPQGANNSNAEQQQMKDLMAKQKQMTALPSGGAPAPGAGAPPPSGGTPS
jgi:phage-related minor tail protein